MITKSWFVRVFGALAAGAMFVAGVVQAAPVVVTNTNDSVAGSLRQAIQNAQTGDTIVFAIPTSDGGYNASTRTWTIALSSTLTISRDLQIDTGGQRVTVARTSGSAAPYFGVFSVVGGTVQFTGLTISGGVDRPTSGNSFVGNAIKNSAVLTLQGCSITNNGLPAGTGAQGGSAVNNTGTLFASNCTFSGNKSDYAGAAIGNSKQMTLPCCAIALNSGSGVPGGISNSGTAHLGSTVVAKNTGSFCSNGFAGCGQDVYGAFVSDGYNFIGNPDGSSGFGAPGSNDQLGSPGSPADPKLNALADNNGPAFTMLPQSGSPLIDQGNSFGLTTDQRDFPRPADYPGITNAGDGSDIGAVERGTVQAGPTFTVNTVAEHDDGSCTTDDCTLLEAMNAANVNADANTIIFAPGLSGVILNTIAATGLKITNPLTITGPGARVLTISGNNASRIFDVASGATGTSITGLTLANAKTSADSGGAIFNAGGLTLDRCAVLNNSGGSGGGAANSGALYVRNCTFAGNQSTGNGGALRNTGFLSVANCTFNDNTAVYGGGAISSFVNSGPSATVDVYNCTISGNKATNANAAGGGLFNGNLSTTTVTETIVVFNQVPDSNNGYDVSGSFTSGGHNLIRFGIGSTGFANGKNGDKVGSVSVTPYAGLDTLKNNGGETDTMALMTGSEAINGGDVNALVTDQRGYRRGDIPDIGAFEFNGIAPPPPTVTTGMATNVTSTSATLNATVNPNGVLTTVQFTMEYASFALQSAGSGTAAVPMTVNATRLTPGTTYHFNVTATSSAGTTTGVQQVFTTAADPTPTPTPGATPTPTPLGTATPTPAPTATPPSQLQNLSTRKQVGTDSNVLIGGFIVVGTEDKKLLLRGLGPSLGIDGALADPRLELHGADTTLLAANNNWQDTQAAEISATGIPPTNDLEAAIIATVPAKPAAESGAGYTGVLAGNGGTTGIGLLEIYDVNTAANSKLANISTRGLIGTGDDVLIGGFIPGPDGRLPLKVLVRALGPSLTAQGVSGALQDPVLELHDANGTLMTDDNWKDGPDAAEIQAILPPPDDRESAIIMTLAPAVSGYTAVVRGANGSTGVALVEVFALN